VTGALASTWGQGTQLFTPSFTFSEKIRGTQVPLWPQVRNLRHREAENWAKVIQLFNETSRTHNARAFLQHRA
jgi:hypothetical protein